MNYVDTLQLIRRLHPTISILAWEAVKDLLDVLPLDDAGAYPIPTLHPKAVTAKDGPLVLGMPGYSLEIDTYGHIEVSLAFPKANRDHQRLILKLLQEYSTAVFKPFPQPVEK